MQELASNQHLFNIKLKLAKLRAGTGKDRALLSVSWSWHISGDPTDLQNQPSYREQHGQGPLRRLRPTSGPVP